MALSKKDNPESGELPAGHDVPGGPEAPAAEEAPKVKEKAPEKDDSTPSGAALAKVGEPPEKASDEKLNEHAAKYAAEKRKVRWG